MSRKIKIIIGVLIVLVVIGIIVLVLYKKSDFTESDQNTDEFDFSQIKYEHYGFCEGGPWELFSNDRGEIYTYEWDTNMYGGYSISCIRSSWKDGVQTFQKLEEKAVSTAYGSGEEVNYTSMDEEGRLFLNGWDGKFYSLDNSGSLIKKIEVLKNSKKFDEKVGYASIRFHYVTGDFVYFIIYETDYQNGIYSLQKFNWKTGEYLSAFEIESFVPEQFTDGVIYGYGEDSIIGMDIYGNEILSIEFPAAYFNMPYNKRSIAVYGNTLYYSDSEGIYSAKKGDESFKRIIKKSETDVLKDSYSIVDMAVNSNGDIYVLAIAGVDEEWPTDLFIISR